MKSTLNIAMVMAVLGSATAAFAAGPAAPQDFVSEAIKGDNSEIMLGKVAMQRGKSPAVKSFGKMLFSDHTLAKQQMVTLAKTLGAPVSDQPMDEATQEEKKLAGLSGAAFDREFATYMIDDHTKDIEKFTAEANAKNGESSTLASQQLPTLQKHLHTAQSLAGGSP
jgi:putative membrane protein